MDKVVIASIRKNAGKTSVIVGLAAALGRKIAYIKPLGDRMCYRDKCLWDLDAALMSDVFLLEKAPKDLSLGFDHSKIRYMYDDEAIRKRLAEMAADVPPDTELLIVEAAGNITNGTSVSLDALSLARSTDAKLIFVLNDEEGGVMDDLAFLKKTVAMEGVALQGVIINKVLDKEAFLEKNGEALAAQDIPILGIVPFDVRLTYLSVNDIIERSTMKMKVMGGETGLSRTVKNVIIGAMNAQVALAAPVFKKEGKLVITGGDRSDMIVAALETDTSAVLVTNDIVPAPTILAKASELDIPILLIATDTYQAANLIHGIEPLLTQGDARKLELTKKLVKESIELERFN